MERKVTKYPSNYVRANLELSRAFSLGRKKPQLYVIEMDNGTRILVSADPKNVHGLDYTGDRLVGCFHWNDQYSNAVDNFLASSRSNGIKRVTPYASEYAALEGESGVPIECIHIECPKDNSYVIDNNILTPKSAGSNTRDYNLFTDYSFDDIVKLVIAADNSPEHMAENINHGFGHNKMICTISD